MSFPRYPEYKTSNTDFIGQVPAHWKLERLKHCAEVFPSNVDKKSVDGQVPVKLCNYTDVYYNDTIGGELGFMLATATKEQAMRFELQQGDVVFTKDSESADDIGVAAYVSKRLPGVVYGYHLSIARANRAAIGEFLKQYFDSQETKSYFAVSANGLTRVGLGQYAVDNAPIALPTVDEQTQIARFLEHETAKIDALIREQERLIVLLQEKRQAVISHAVTKGLDPSVTMKSSGVEWLGEVPEHWSIGALKRALEMVADVDHFMPTSVPEGVPYVMTGDLRSLASEIEFDLCKQVAREDFVRLARKIRTSKGDVVMARYATIGTVSYIDIDAEFVVSYSCVTIRPQAAMATGRYLFFYFQSDAFIQGMSNMINANTQGNVGIGDLKEVKIALPDIYEQEATVNKLEVELTYLDGLVDEVKKTIGFMKERRSALISAAVTGKIDVRDWQPPADENAFNREVREAGLEATA